VKLSNDKLAYQKRIIELIDPVAWLRTYTDFRPWSYETELLRSSHLRTRVVRKSRQVGITTTIAHEAAWRAFTSPSRIILIVSPSLRQSEIVMRKIITVIDANAFLIGQVSRKSRTEIMLTNGSRIICLPNNPDRFRGFTATEVYLDEAAHFKNDEPVLRVVRPMISASHGRMTIISTPSGKRGLFYNQYMMAVNRRGTDHETKAFDFFPSTISPLITKEFLLKEPLNLTELEFKQEYLGEFIEEADTYLPMELIHRCVDEKLQLIDEGDPQKSYVMGIDLAKQRDETVVIILERTKDEHITRHISAWAHMDYADQVGRIGELGEKFTIIGAMVDQTGVGEAVMEELQAYVRGVKGVKFTQKMKHELASGLRYSLEHRTLVLPNHQKLITQLNSLHYKISKGGEFMYESPSTETVHDDYVWALALAVYAARKTPFYTRRPIVCSLE
jgi:phage FluMu gp28-like protein